MPRTARCTTARHAVATGLKNPLVDPRAGAPVASGAMISTTRTPGALTVGPLRPVILKLAAPAVARSEEHTSELQSHLNLVCRLLLEKKNTYNNTLALRSHQD